MITARLLGAAALAAALTVGAQIPAAHATAAPAAAQDFKDCFLPGADPNRLVTSVNNPLTFRESALRCGREGGTGFGVLHINEGHPPFNEATVRCIEHVLRTTTFEQEATGEDNVLYMRSNRTMDAFVVVNADTNNVVTAYTSRGGTSASNEWEACAAIV